MVGGALCLQPVMWCTCSALGSSSSRTNHLLAASVHPGFLSHFCSPLIFDRFNFRRRFFGMWTVKGFRLTAVLGTLGFAGGELR